VRVHCDEGVATHIGPEPCVFGREAGDEASAGDRTGQPLSRERNRSERRRRLTSGRQHGRGHDREHASGSAWSETLACTDASCTGNREVSGSTTGRWPCGPHREGDEPKPVMHERENSDPAMVAAKPANKPARAGAEAAERRAGAEENASQDGTHRTPGRASVSPGLERVRQVAFAVTHPRWEPYALIGPVRICAGRAP